MNAHDQRDNAFHVGSGDQVVPESRSRELDPELKRCHGSPIRVSLASLATAAVIGMGLAFEAKAGPYTFTNIVDSASFETFLGLSMNDSGTVAFDGKVSAFFDESPSTGTEQTAIKSVSRTKKRGTLFNRLFW